MKSSDPRADTATAAITAAAAWFMPNAGFQILTSACLRKRMAKPTSRKP